ncbi:MAG: hypothetical protein GEU86_00020 [Actinophytocola sp.]|nr:hypothetical protein [Actinophytocola sp.]
MVGEFERKKDTVQEITESTAERVGNIAKIVADAVVAIAREVGDGVTDAIEMREAANRAKADEETTTPDQADPPTIGDPGAEKPGQQN